MQMDLVPREGGQPLVERASGKPTPFNASDALKAVCEMHPVPIPSSHRARLGKAAKELLDDGFEVKFVCAAMLHAVQRARPDMVQTFALQLANASVGIAPTWRQWNDGLQRLSSASDPELSSIYNTLRAA